MKKLFLFPLITVASLSTSSGLCAMEPARAVAGDNNKDDGLDFLIGDVQAELVLRQQGFGVNPVPIMEEDDEQAASVILKQFGKDPYFLAKYISSVEKTRQQEARALEARITERNEKDKQRVVRKLEKEASEQKQRMEAERQALISSFQEQLQLTQQALGKERAEKMRALAHAERFQEVANALSAARQQAALAQQEVEQSRIEKNEISEQLATCQAIIDALRDREPQEPPTEVPSLAQRMVGRPEEYPSPLTLGSPAGARSPVAGSPERRPVDGPVASGTSTVREESPRRVRVDGGAEKARRTPSAGSMYAVAEVVTHAEKSDEEESKFAGSEGNVRQGQRQESKRKKQPTAESRGMFSRFWNDMVHSDDGE